MVCSHIVGIQSRVREVKLTDAAWTGLGNPQGGLVFTNAFDGSYEQTHEWTSFMGASESISLSSLQSSLPLAWIDRTSLMGVDEFCVRACQDGPSMFFFSV